MRVETNDGYRALPALLLARPGINKRATSAAPACAAIQKDGKDRRKRQ